MSPTLEDLLSTLPRNPPHGNKVIFLIYSFSETCFLAVVVRPTSFPLVLHHFHCEGLGAGEMLTGKQEVPVSILCVRRIRGAPTPTQVSTGRGLCRSAGPTHRLVFSSAFGESLRAQPTAAPSCPGARRHSQVFLQRNTLKRNILISTLITC